MLTQPAKVFLPLTLVGVVAAVLYSGLTADHTGTILFVGLATAALAGALTLTVARENELAPVVEPDAGPPQWRPASPARLPGGPGWPALAGIGTGFLALGLILGPLFAIPGAVLIVIAATGWLGSVASDRTGRSPDLMPIGIPVIGLGAIFSLMFFMSRILLAVPEQASTVIALTVAVTVMAGASFFAVRPSISPRSVMTALIIGSLFLVGGGLVAAAAGQREVEKHHSGPEALEVEASNIKFDKAEIDLPANAEAEIKFHNADSVPHNVAIYGDANFTGRAIFQGGVVVGPGSIEYRFTAPPPGTYFFRCDIHPSMQGKVTVA